MTNLTTRMNDVEEKVKELSLMVQNLLIIKKDPIRTIKKEKTNHPNRTMTYENSKINYINKVR